MIYFVFCLKRCLVFVCVVFSFFWRSLGFERGVGVRFFVGVRGFGRGRERFLERVIFESVLRFSRGCSGVIFFFLGSLVRF